MKKTAVLILALVLIGLLSCVSADTGEFTQWMASGATSGTNTQAFLPGAENRPSKEELTTMLKYANTYFQCHALTGTHFIVIQDKAEQEEIMGFFASRLGLDCSGTVMVLVMADGVKDQEHHAAQYFPGSSAENGGNPEYWNMYYGIYEAGWATGYLNLLARDMGYRTRVYAALNIPNAETGEVMTYGTGGNFKYINGENWEISKFMQSKDGTENFDHYVMALKDHIPLEGNVTLLCAMIIGKVDETDAVSAATVYDDMRMQNFDFWDWNDDYQPMTNQELAAAAKLADGKEDGEYTGTGTDLHGEISLKVTVKDQQITALEVTEDTKSVLFSDEAAITAFLDSIINGQTLEVDGISGATLETDAIKDAIRNALN